MADQLPTVKFSGDFGDIGETVNHSHGTYTATGTISAPILQMAKTRGEEDVAGAQYAQASDKLADQVQQVNAEIRDSILDIQSAAKLVEAAKSNVDLANEAVERGAAALSRRRQRQPARLARPRPRWSRPTTSTSPRCTSTTRPSSRWRARWASQRPT